MNASIDETCPPWVSGLAAVADRYDGFLIDLWGVVHDGERAYPDVAACLARLRCAGRRICLLSNAPRRARGVVIKLAGFGIDPPLYDHVLTSGELARAALAAPPDPWHRALGPRFLHIGPARDRDIFTDLSHLTEVDRPEDADFLLNTGPVDFDDPLEAYQPMLDRAVVRGLPMLCANPDRVVMVGARRVMCAGALADRYAAIGGEVRYHGKPHALVYARALALLGVPADQPGRVLAIGDSLDTDVAGARAVGTAIAFVAGGIHREALGQRWGEQPAADRLAGLFAAAGVRPDYVVPRLVW